MNEFDDIFPRRERRDDQLTDEQLEKAFRFWFGTYRFREIDCEIEKLFNIEPRNTWLKDIRNAQNFTIADIAHKLKIRGESYRKLELSEQARTISMSSLAAAADALNCELVYGLRPKTGRKLARQLWDKVVALYQDEYWVQSKPEHLKPSALAAVARQKLSDPKIKKKLLRF